jgi:adenylate cyclase
MGEQTAAKLPPSRVFEVDLIQVKGRNQPTRIFTLAELFDCDEAKLSRLRTLQGELLQAYRAQRWDAAESSLTECYAMGCDALNSYYRVFADRIAALRHSGMAADWDGTFAMTEK